MGITGLLPLMKNASTDISLSKLRDTVAAVDTNVWIHRACYSCADKIYLNESTDLFINYCINNCNLLKSYNITPILIFDGQNLPAKSETKLERKKRKEEIRKQVEDLLKHGKESEARWLMRQCVDVTFEMIQRVIERCRKENIDYIVAPYEADAQITYLVNNNLADYAITEDSDLLAFGCRRALYKLDRDTARGRMIDLDRLDRCFKNFNFQKFQYMCILSGCDYLTNIPNVAIGRSKKFFELLPNATDLNDIENIIKLLPALLNMVNKIKIPENYIEDFKKALNTFNYQLIYSPLQNNFTHLNKLKNGIKHEDICLYAGDFFNENLLEKNNENHLDLVQNYILGNICPKTLKFLDNYNPLEEEQNKSKQFWKSKLILERIEKINKNKIDKFFDSNSIYRKSNNKKSQEEDDDEDVKILDEIPIYPKQLKQTKRKINEKQIINNNNENNNSSFTKLKNHSDLSSSATTKPRLTRNMFKKFKNENLNEIETKDDNIIKSKYFQSNENHKSSSSSDELEFLELLPEQKKSKTNDDLNNISISSIEDDDCQLLMELNSKLKSKSIDNNKKKSFRKRSDSLSSTQTQSSSSSSSSCSSSEQSSSSSSINRSSNRINNNKSKDIRNYFN